MIYVDILGIKYSIQIVSVSELLRQLKETNSSYNEIIEVIGQNGEHFAGLCDNMQCRIWINDDIKSKEKMKKVLLHEIIEACVSESLIDIDHTSIQALSNALFTSKLIDSFLENVISKTNIEGQILNEIM